MIMRVTKSREYHYSITKNFNKEIAVSVDIESAKCVRVGQMLRL